MVGCSSNELGHGEKAQSLPRWGHPREIVAKLPPVQIKPLHLTIHAGRAMLVTNREGWVCRPDDGMWDFDTRYVSAYEMLFKEMWTAEIQAITGSARSAFASLALNVGYGTILGRSWAWARYQIRLPAVAHSRPHQGRQALTAAR